LLDVGYAPKNEKRTTHLFETSTLAPDFSLVGVWKFIINKKGENMKFFEINNPSLAFFVLSNVCSAE
jgi:hypothetical protein